MPSSTKNRLTSVAAAVVTVVALFGLLSPAVASEQNNPAVLTLHSPWLAPIGGNLQGRTFPRTRFCRPGNVNNRISMSNSIES